MTGQNLGSPGRAIAKIHRTTDLTTVSSTTYVTFDVEDIDSDNMVDLVANNDRITINTPGIYVAQFVYRQDSTTGNVWIHGGAAGTTRLAASRQSPQAVWGTLMSHPKQCAAGEFFRIFLDAVGMIIDGSTGAPDYTPYFSVWRIDG